MDTKQTQFIKNKVPGFEPLIRDALPTGDKILERSLQAMNCLVETRRACITSPEFKRIFAESIIPSLRPFLERVVSLQDAGILNEHSEDVRAREEALLEKTLSKLTNNKKWANDLISTVLDKLFQQDPNIFANQVIDGATQNLGDIGVPSELVKRYMTYLFVRLGPISLHADFLASCYNEEEHRELFDILLTDQTQSEIDCLFKDFVSHHSILGSMTALTYCALTNSESLLQVNSPKDKKDQLAICKEWYPEVISKIAKTWCAVNNCFSELEARVRKNETALTQVLKNWRKEISTVLFESADIATIYALQVALDGQYCPFYEYTTFPVPYACDREKLLSELKELVPAFSRLNYNISGSLNRNIAACNMPILLGELLSTVDYQLEYWQSFEAALLHQASWDKDFPGQIRLASFARIATVTPTDPTKDVRLVIRPLPSKFAGFDLRIDLSKGKLNFDYGGVDSRKAFTFAKYYSHLYPEHIPTMEESLNYRETEKRQNKHSRIEVPSLTEAERASLFISVGASHGHFMSTRWWTPMSYHMNEYVSFSIEPQEFKAVVHQFKELFLRRRQN